MPINLAEVLQVSFDLVKRAEQAEAQVLILQAEIEKLRAELQEALLVRKAYGEELTKFYREDNSQLVE